MQAPGFYRMMVGDFEVTALSDGTVALPVDKLLTRTTPARSIPATAGSTSSVTSDSPWGCLGIGPHNDGPTAEYRCRAVSFCCLDTSIYLRFLPFSGIVQPDSQCPQYAPNPLTFGRGTPLMGGAG